MGFTGTAADLIAEAVAAGRWTPIAPARPTAASDSGIPEKRNPPTKPRAKPVALVEPGYRCGTGWAEWTVPLRLELTTNGSAIKPWLVGVAGKHRREVARALAARLRKLAWFRHALDAGRLLRCTITRLGGRECDCDALPPMGKWVRDTVALFLGQDDGPAGPIRWGYHQEPGKEWGVRIRLEKA